MLVFSKITCIFTLTFLMCNPGCSPRKSTWKKEKSEISPNCTVYKITSRDSIVLTDGIVPFFGGVEIFRNQKSILKYTHQDLQINSIDVNGNDSNWFTEHKERIHSVYIIRIFNGPEPDRFLVLRSNSDNVATIGITEPNSAEIFGDIDFDEKFEIGGFSQYCQGGDLNCHPIDHYTVFELEEKFPLDKKLTDFFKQTLQNK